MFTRMRGGTHMTAVEKEKQSAEISQTEDVNEFMELLKELTRDEKTQVKGIMIGMQMTRQLVAQTA